MRSALQPLSPVPDHRGQTGESRASGHPPASGHQIPSSRLPLSKAALSRRGALRTGRPPKAYSFPKHLGRVRFPQQAQAFVIRALAHFPPAKRVSDPFRVHSHLRRVSLPAAHCQVQS